jgi:hypothetical protein
MGPNDPSSLFPRLGRMENRTNHEERRPQIAEIQDALQYEHEQKYVNPVVIEHTPDGSRAQDLLGGTLQIKAPWVDNGDEH